MSDPDRLIPRYYAYRATNSAGLYLPIAIYFLVDRGYGNEFVLFSYAVFSLASVAAEIPTGYLGDLVGRRGSLALGSGLRVGALATYPFVDTKLAILAIHVVWATGRAFRSGTVDAWLYETLQARFDESEYARIEGRGSTVLLVTSAGGAIAGALLYTVDPAYPFLANAGLALLGLPILFTFPAVATEASDDEVFTVREAVRTLRLQAGRPAVRWLVVYAAIDRSSSRRWTPWGSPSPAWAYCTPRSSWSRPARPRPRAGSRRPWAPAACSPCWAHCTPSRTPPWRSSRSPSSRCCSSTGVGV
jgi:MFS family permease